jgi:hypothetical protein
MYVSYTYAQLQQQIANRLDQRTDLQQIIYDFSQDRIAFWSAYFFYNSNITDTSITTNAGQYMYTLPGNMGNLRKMRLLLPGNTQAYATLGQTYTLPQTILKASNVNLFTTNGAILVAGSQVVSYTGVNTLLNEFTGCAGGSGLVTVGSGISQISPSTTTTSPVTLPITDLPVASSSGFLPAGMVSVGGTQLSYASTDSTDFLGVTGGQAGLTIASGSLVQQLYGIWIPVDEVPYLRILDIDPLAPPFQTIPSQWGPFGNQFRLYPTPDAAYPLELTGMGGPSAPQLDTDVNAWTQDYATLIINDTCAEIYDGYLHNPDRADRYRQLAMREKNRLSKESWDLGSGPKIIKGHL